jgi:WD40 repeat protein
MAGQYCSEGSVHSAEDEASRREAPRLYELLETWRLSEQKAGRAVRWLRSLRPPETRLGSPQIAVLRGHRGAVTKVAYSSDGTKIASASADKLIVIWDAMSGAELTRLQGHTEQVDAVAFSPDGSRLVSCSPDKTVRLWDANSGAQLFCRGVQRLVHNVAFSPDGKAVALACSDEVIRVWDSTTGSETCCLHGHDLAVTDVAYSPDGTRLVSASEDRTVRIWEATTGRQLACLKGHEHAVQSVAFSNDGHLIVSTSDSHKVRVWDASSGSELSCLVGSAFNWPDEENWYYSPRFSPDTTLVAAGSCEGVLVVWSVSSKTIVGSYWGHESAVTTVMFSPNGKWIASGSADGTIRIWQIGGYRSGHLGLRLKNHSSPIWCIAFSPGGERLATGSYDKRVCLWDSKNGESVATLQGHESIVSAVRFSDDGRILASASEDGSVLTWDVITNSLVTRLRSQKGDVTALAFTQDSRWLLSAVLVSGRFLNPTCDADDVHGDVPAMLSGRVSFEEIFRLEEPHTLVSIWDLQSRSLHGVLRGPGKQKIATVALSTDGRELIIETSDGFVWTTGFPERDGKRTEEWNRDSPENLKEAQSPQNVQSRVDGLETAIESSDNRNAVAWWPNRLSPIEQHPKGLAWAGAVGKHLCLIALDEDLPNKHG